MTVWELSMWFCSENKLPKGTKYFIMPATCLLRSKLHWISWDFLPCKYPKDCSLPVLNTFDHGPVKQLIRFWESIQVFFPCVRANVFKAVKNAESDDKKETICVLLDCYGKWTFITPFFICIMGVYFYPLDWCDAVDLYVRCWANDRVL